MTIDPEKLQTEQYIRRVLNEKGYVFSHDVFAVLATIRVYKHNITNNRIEVWTTHDNEITVHDNLGNTINVDDLPNTNRDASGSGGSYETEESKQ